MVPSRSTSTNACRLVLKMARRLASERRSASSARAFSVRDCTRASAASIAGPIRARLLLSR